MNRLAMYKIFENFLGKTQPKSGSEDYLKKTILNAKALGNDEKQIILRFLAMSNSTVEDLIIPRSDIRGVQESDTFFHILQVFGEVKCKQIIVYEGTLDKIKGYVDFSDVLAYAEEPQNFSVSKVRKEITFVVPNMKIIDAIKQMQLVGSENLVVVDEFGGVDGMVSMDKIIEEVFGEFGSYSANNTLIYSTSVAGEFLVDAKAPVELCEDRLGVKLLIPDENGESPDIETIGGLVTTSFGRVPSVGEVIDHPSGVRFVIKDATPRRVLRMLVQKNDANPGK